MKLPLITAVTTAIMGAALLTAGAAAAQAPVPAQHPRRVEVNHRLTNQNRRINHEVRTGQMGVMQARHLKAQDRAIRHRERVVASRHHGHITRVAQARLNHRENVVSHRISD